jgi:flagellar protein FliO/FliZ
MNAAFPPARKVGAAFACTIVFSCLALPSIAADPALPPLATSSFASMLQVLFGLGLVLGAIAGTAWLLRRFAPGQVAASGAIRVVGGVAVGPKERVVLVDVGETRLVLGVAPGHVSTLHQMPRPAGEPTAVRLEGDAGKFYARLKEILHSKNQGGAA